MSDMACISTGPADGAQSYIFIGCIILSGHWYTIVPGTIVGIAGIGYVALEFIPSIEPPANMREADAGWGAEQI